MKSTVYRFSVMIYWIIRTEKALYSLDTVFAEKNDTKYIKYIKAIRQILTDNQILKELDYKESDIGNHFYANELPKYAELCCGDTNEVIEFHEAEKCSRFRDKKYEKIFYYFSEVENNSDNRNYNVLKCLHLLIISFLNDFGHDYQKTSRLKFKDLLSCYNNIKIKKGFYFFLHRNKLVFEMKFPLQKLGIGIVFMYQNRYRRKCKQNTIEHI